MSFLSICSSIFRLWDRLNCGRHTICSAKSGVVLPSLFWESLWRKPSGVQHVLLPLLIAHAGVRVWGDGTLGCPSFFLWNCFGACSSCFVRCFCNNVFSRVPKSWILVMCTETKGHWCEAHTAVCSTHVDVSITTWMGIRDFSTTFYSESLFCEDMSNRMEKIHHQFFQLMIPHPSSWYSQPYLFEC